LFNFLLVSRKQSLNLIEMVPDGWEFRSICSSKSNSSYHTSSSKIEKYQSYYPYLSSQQQRNLYLLVTRG
jgi:hypothetical protein